MSALLCTTQFRFAMALATFVAIISLAAGETPGQRPPEPAVETSGGPYCGVYSLYAALRLHGKEVAFADLLTPKYISSYKGSTLGELRQAAMDFGAHAEAVDGLTAASLRASSDPIILHVRRPGFGTPYAHWVLFLGVEGGKARIVDPPHAVQLLPFAELLALWDGTGLMVAKAPVSTWPVRVAAWLELGALLLFVVTVLGLARLAWERTSGRSHRPIGLAVLPSLALFIAVAAHVIADEGFFHNQAALAQVIGGHFKPQLAGLSVQEVADLLRDPNVTLIDARYPQAYEQGHLPGAINLPVYSGLVERSTVLGRIRPTHRVIVYCQSDRCPWGEVIASDLYYRGYRQTSLFPGGWNAWVKHEQARSRPRDP